MTMVYVERDGQFKIVAVNSTVQENGINERINDQAAEVQSFLNPLIPADTDDVVLDEMYTVPFIRAIVKKLSAIEGKSEFQVRNELKVLAKQ